MTSQDYDAFVSQKLTRQPPTGLSTVPALHDGLFPFRGDPRCARKCSADRSDVYNPRRIEIPSWLISNPEAP